MSKIDKQIDRPICNICNKNQCKKNGISKYGFQNYSKTCSLCQKKLYDLPFSNGRKPSYRNNKKDYCELCGFIPKHQCQLDVDNIDNNSRNNDLSNLQTLCANCHRLKTYLNSNTSYIYVNKKT